MSRSCEAGTSAAVVARVDRFFADDVAKYCRDLAALEELIGPDAIPEKGDRMHDRVQEAFLESQDACRRFEVEMGDEPAVIKDAQRDFRAATDRWFDRSWIAHRSRTKPSGFPGDYEMLLGLYRESTPARGIGGYLDLCILDLPLARAVRARLQTARHFLLQETDGHGENFRVLDVASGPCSEYLNWPPRENGLLEIVAMDTDPHSIDYVTNSVVPQLPERVRLLPVRYNALRTRNADVTVDKFGRFDLIYSVGLCDYLSDDCLIEMLRAWRQTLNSDGTLYVAFKDAERYPKQPYQWHLDWYFFQRTLQDCQRLYELAGFDVAEIDMQRDATGIIMNFVFRQKGVVPEPHFSTRAARRRNQAPASIDNSSLDDNR